MRLFDTQTPWTDNDTSLLFAALGKAKPQISARNLTFDLDPDPDLKAR